MAITNGYATLDEARDFVDYTTGYTADNTEIETAVEAASRLIDEYTGDIFYQADALTLYFTPTAYDELRVLPSLRAVTTLKTGPGNGTFPRTWTTDDYNLLPYNQLNGEPYRAVQVSEDGSYLFQPGVTRSVELVGNFGWDAVPTPVKQACLLEANRLHFRRTSPSGIAGTLETGAVSMRAGMDPDAKKLLRPYRRLAMVVP